MKPGERIREFRKKLKLKQKEFAKALGFTQAYLTEIERGKREPSRDFLKKLNSVFGLSSDFVLFGEEKKTENLEKFASEGLMPLKFIQRLKKDIEALPNPEDFFSSINIPKQIIETALEGKLILNRTSVIEIAQKINQPIYEYLLLANYLPDEIIKFTDHPGIIEIFKQIGMLHPKEMEEVLQTITSVLKPYIKRYQPKE